MANEVRGHKPTIQNSPKSQQDVLCFFFSCPRLAAARKSTTSKQIDDRIIHATCHGARFCIVRVHVGASHYTVRLLYPQPLLQVGICIAWYVQSQGVFAILPPFESCSYNVVEDW